MADKRPLLTNIQIGHNRGLALADIRTAAKSDPAAFMGRVQSLIDADKLTLGQLGDLRSLYAALADVEVPITIPDVAGVPRAMTTSAFPVLVGSTVVAAVNAAYQAVPTVGEQLVTEMDDPKAVTVVAQINALDKDQDRVKEGDDYPEVSASEETVEIGQWRSGRMLKITAETIEQNDLANITSRVNALGRIASTFVEEHTLKRVIDLYGSAAAAAAPYVYRPNGSGTALYSATANTPGTRAPSGTRYTNNAFVDETDLDNVRGRLAGNKSDLGKPLPINYGECVVLCPDALAGAVLKVKNSELVPGTVNEFSNWGPRGQYGGFKPISTPYLDQWSTSAWYYGMPQRQFTRKWALRFEYVTLGQSTESYLRSRIAFQARVGWNCEVGATDYVWFIQCLSGTTPPS